MSGRHKNRVSVYTALVEVRPPHQSSLCLLSTSECPAATPIDLCLLSTSECLAATLIESPFIQHFFFLLSTSRCPAFTPIDSLFTQHYWMTGSLSDQLSVYSALVDVQPIQPIESLFTQYSSPECYPDWLVSPTTRKRSLFTVNEERNKAWDVPRECSRVGHVGGEKGVTLCCRERRYPPPTTKFVAAVPAAEQHLDRLVKQRRAWLLLGWETMERSRPYK
ncbi:hypothetical protein J6590_050086 [Homalodisca vitripennis]|nr:hypothetical protein J6590_050086 [Homalodisca vitripennis]